MINNLRKGAPQEYSELLRRRGAPQEYFQQLRRKGAPQEYFQALRARGAAMLMFVLFFAFTSSVMMFSLNQSIFMDLADFNQMIRSKQAYLSAESAVEDVVYRNVFGTFAVGNSESVTIGGVTAAATTVYDSGTDEYLIIGSATKGTSVRKAEAILSVTAGSAFNFGLQAGNGGITLSNNSDIFGNVYSNGLVLGAGSAEVFGDIVSAGPTGRVKDITATGSIYANTIDNIDAGMNAYYNVDVGSSVVAGTRFTPAANQPLSALPISTTTIQEWKDSITNYGTTIAAGDPACASGTYTINTSITIGYLRVNCNVEVRGAGTILTLTGPVWVQGNLTFRLGPTVRAAASVGRRSVQFIVDNPTNRLTSSLVQVLNSTNFAGSGDPRSYVMILSMNESASLGGTQRAIDVTNSAIGDVLVYAGSGLIDIGNNIDLREVTAYQIEVSNGASVTYESGLANLLFTSGPGGGYTLADWQQID